MPTSRAAARALLRGARLLLDTVLPPLCPGCERELPPRFWLCPACRRRLRPAPPGSICFRCRVERRPGGSREAGRECADPGHAGDRGWAAWWMEPPLDAVIHAFKYRDRSDLAPALGRLLAARVPLPGPAPPAGVLGVPLHRTRLRARGYDQAGLLARAAAVRWGVPPMTGLLVRSRGTRAQARLAEADRAANVASAFRAPHPSWAAGRDWVLVDDVVTTGATIQSAAGALREAGARRVVPVALALA